MEKKATLSSLKEHTHVEENQHSQDSSNDQLQYNEEYLDTGIWIRGNETHGYFATAGNHRITEIMDSPDIVRQQLDMTDWSTVITVICILSENIIKEKLSLNTVNDKYK